ncbi:MAG: hypothetical protein GY809_01620 [Planctomycetes bacterium]|nr:hypothetical protein [Planctomycetota bacterium]
MISKQLAKILKRLSEQGAMPASDLSGTHRQTLNALFATEILLDVRKGRGYCVKINKGEAFSAFIAKHCPEGLSDSDIGVLSRSEGIAKLRNSKQGRLNSEVVMVSAKPGQVLVRGRDQLEVGHLTEMAGVASLVLDEGKPDYWKFLGHIVSVENYASFIHWRRMGIEADIAIWTGGRISDRVIRWFKSSAMQGCTFEHSGDYDPVGLDEFLRLKKALTGDRVTLFAPMTLKCCLNSMPIEHF